MLNEQVLRGMEKAAEMIERNPDQFDFCSVSIPKNRETRGCAIGFTLAAMGENGVGNRRCRFWHTHIAERALGVSEYHFYALLDREDLQWRDNGKRAACAMRRALARMGWRSEPMKKGLPEKVLSLFKAKGERASVAWI